MKSVHVDGAAQTAEREVPIFGEVHLHGIRYRGSLWRGFNTRICGRTREENEPGFVGLQSDIDVGGVLNRRDRTSEGVQPFSKFRRLAKTGVHAHRMVFCVCEEI